MPYEIEYTAAAARDLRSLRRSNAKDLEAIKRRIEELGRDPRPRGAAKLEGKEGFLRVRQGDYRIIYRVEDDRLVVLVVRVAARDKVYRR